MNTINIDPEVSALLDQIWPKLRPQMQHFYDLWPQTDRPPILEDMMPDIDRLINSVALKFTDRTCAHLHFDEMVGECRLKLAELVDRGELTRQPTRSNFFKFFKTAIQNHARSRVQKYRFTEKRTGVKPPPREARTYTPEQEHEDGVHHDTVSVMPEHHKSVELSLDDEELNVQVSTSASGLNTNDDEEYREVVSEYEVLLTDVEVLVFRQMAAVNERGCQYAYLDACVGKHLEKVTVKIKNKHLAQGIGMSPELFEEAVLSIRQKILAYRNMTEEERLQETRRNATLAQLKQVFGLQIPPGTDDLLVRRLLSIAARDQYSKVEGNVQLQEMLEEMGAKVPRLQGDGNLACYGVLYQKNHRHCNHCGLRESCSVEASNIGLGKIALSPRLLGARQTRVPAVLPTLEEDEPLQQAASVEEAEILNYLDETFVRAVRDDETFFGLRSEDNDADKRIYLFCVEGGGDKPFRLRFCSPSESLKARLEGLKRAWYAPASASVADIISLIDQHADETMEAAHV